ncbi:LOW QUALITY PROTEIN: universal stress protein A-like protein [Salvia miltiorrhiza]|uniref:LOW QUALITY PROTEIN: universal stress protein A-like protein n=1 Tax=Salvia miltiorrhiza TaxID=226208 RepID=UPI0025ABEF1B|nr:LOW QUALITY PROTEIN: universal stress protein A-like protein [Salvia miltiorrhiza]
MEEVTTTGGATTAAATNVLVAIDDSEESFHALRWAIEKILKRKSATVVTIAHVVEPLPRYAFPGGLAVVESASKAQEQNGARILSRAYEMCRESSLKAKTIILEGDPKDRICRAVEEMNINLLVVGSRGLGQIKRAFLGSVSDTVLNTRNVLFS